MPDEDRFFKLVGRGWGGVYSRAWDGAADEALLRRAVKAAAAELRRLGLDSGVIEDALAVRDGRLRRDEFRRRLKEGCVCGSNSALRLAAERAWLRTIPELPAGPVSAERVGGVFAGHFAKVMLDRRCFGRARAGIMEKTGRRLEAEFAWEGGIVAGLRGRMEPVGRQLAAGGAVRAPRSPREHFAHSLERLERPLGEARAEALP